MCVRLFVCLFVCLLVCVRGACATDKNVVCVHDGAQQPQHNNRSTLRSTCCGITCEMASRPPAINGVQSSGSCMRVAARKSSRIIAMTLLVVEAMRRLPTRDGSRSVPRASGAAVGSKFGVEMVSASSVLSVLKVRVRACVSVSGGRGM